MRQILRAIFALAFASFSFAAFAAAPPPVPALPDTDRVTTYSLSGSTCACAVNFALYGDSTDYQNWLTVWINGIQVTYNDPTFGWTVTSPTGPLSTIPRPITDAVLTFNNAQTATVQIVGARRPRRVSQFSENAGVPARDLNQAVTDIIAQNRETWDLWERTLVFEPGFFPNALPLAAARANTYFCFNVSGQPATCANVSGTTVVSGTGITISGTPVSTISVNLTAGTGIAVAPSGAAEQIGLANMNANTTLCNPTGSPAAPQNCTVGQMQTMLAIQLIPTVNVVTSSRSVAPTDCGNEIQMGPGVTQQTLTLPASLSGFNAPCIITIRNGSTYSAGSSRGMIMSGFPAGVYYILFPGQSFDIEISQGAWVLRRAAGRWMQQGPVLYAANGGSDSANDCLSSATACSTINHTVNGVLYQQIDNLNASPIVYLYGSGTWNECVTLQGQLTGINVGFIEGNNGQAIWNGSGVCADLLIADNAEWEISAITFSQGGAGGTGVYIHQTGVVDMLGSTNFTTFTGGGCAVGSDRGGFINFDQGGGPLNVGPGTIGTFLCIGPGTQMVGSFTFTGNATVNVSNFMTITGAGAMANFSGIATGGSFASLGGSTCKGPNAFTLGSSLPGGAPTASLGCQSE